MRAPLMSKEQATKLLEEVVYERVLACVQLMSLFRFELDLWVAVHEAGLGDEERSREIASEMIDRALHRVADDEQRYALFDQCEVCGDDAPKPSAS